MDTIHNSYSFFFKYIFSSVHVSIPAGTKIKPAALYSLTVTNKIEHIHPLIVMMNIIGIIVIMVVIFFCHNHLPPAPCKRLPSSASLCLGERGLKNTLSLTQITGSFDFRES